MLLQKEPSLEECIIYELSQRPALSAKQLHQYIEKKGRAYSLRAVYKELSKLEKDEVVYKVKKEYRLRLTWLINLTRLIENAYSAYTSPDHLSGLLLKDKGRQTQKFTNLRRLDLYWMQLMMALQKLYPDESMYVWCPYQWFHLVHDYSVAQFYRAEDISGGRRYHIFGNDSYLARLALKTFPKEGAYSFAEGPFDRERTNYYTLIGSHIITTKLDERITKKIAELFDSVNCEADIDEIEMSKIFSSKVNASATVELNESKANKFRTKFKDYFGIK